MKIHKYRSDAPRLFNSERKKLISILGKNCLIEHIGSTAIPGTDGKGVIDIMLGFNNFRQREKAVFLLKNQGYFLSSKSRKSLRDQSRIFMSSAGEKESGPGDFHLHLVLKKGRVLAEAVAFRDYLTSHPKEKKQYAKLKYQLAKKVGKNRALYTKLKKDFINKSVKKAKKF